MTRRPTAARRPARAARPAGVRRLRVAAPAVALAAGLTLTACGEGPGPGVAVASDAETVSVDRVVGLTEEVLQDTQVPPQARAELQRSIVALLVQEQVYDAVARDLGVSVQQGDIDAELATLAETGVDVRAQLRERGVPPSFLPSYVRLVLLQQRLLEEVGGEAELRDLLVATARQLDVEVNPRLGAFEPEALAVAPVEPALSSPAAGAPPA